MVEHVWSITHIFAALTDVLMTLVLVYVAPPNCLKYAVCYLLVLTETELLMLVHVVDIIHVQSTLRHELLPQHFRLFK